MGQNFNNQTLSNIADAFQDKDAVNLRTLSRTLNNFFPYNLFLGVGTLSDGTTTIISSSITTSSLVFLTNTSGGPNIGVLSIGNIINSTSFVVNSSNALDNSNFNWFFIQSA